MVGFTAGALFPGRFTAPLVAVGAVVLHLVGTHAVNDPNMPNLHDLLSLGANVPPYDMGVFYRVPLDVPIAQVMFMGGIAVAAAGVLALSPALRHVVGRGSPPGGGTGRWLRGVSVALVAAGVAASGTAYNLTGTAKLTAAGWNIPALHDAAAGRPVPYTPDCAKTGFDVCVHPAFGTYLGAVAAALDPVAAEIAGLPGAPVRAEQVPYGPPFYGSPIAGAPPVYEFTVTITWVNPAAAGPLVQQGLLSDFIGGPAYEQSGNLGPAQQAMVSALLTAAGVSAQAQALNGPPPAPQVTAAANRFAALSPAVRHAWLAGHLPALRAGHITPARLP